MIKDITLGQYYPGSSILHRTDPRIKILLTLVYMIVIFLIKDFEGYALAVLFTLFLIMVSKVPFGYTIKGLKPVLILIVIVALINFLTVREGQTLLEYGIFRITLGGIYTAVKMALRLILLIVTASLLTLTTTPILLTDGIEKLLEPFNKIGVPSHEIAMMMTIALRFIPTLMTETDKIMKAQAARGADFDTGNLLQRAKAYIPVLIPLFVSAFRRADELATAMESRCYRGSEGRTRMKQLELTTIDLRVTIIMTIFIVLIVFLEYII